MKKFLIIIIFLGLGALLGAYVGYDIGFEEAIEKVLGDRNNKSDLIIVESPKPGEEIKSPFVIEGRARGYWFFEATAPVVVTDWDGLIIGEGYIETIGEWMTEDFVSFRGTVQFDRSKIRGDYSNKGTLILKKANASGLPEHDDAIEIPIVFSE